MKAKQISKHLSLEHIDRVIEMAWEDRTPFDAIEVQFGLQEADVIILMRNELRQSSFKLWRKRVHSGASMKHRKKQPVDMLRFKSSRQGDINLNKIAKR